MAAEESDRQGRLIAEANNCCEARVSGFRVQLLVAKELPSKEVLDSRPGQSFIIGKRCGLRPLAGHWRIPDLLMQVGSTSSMSRAPFAQGCWSPPDRESGRQRCGCCKTTAEQFNAVRVKTIERRLILRRTEVQIQEDTLMHTFGAARFRDGSCLRSEMLEKASDGLGMHLAMTEGALLFSGWSRPGRIAERWALSISGGGGWVGEEGPLPRANGVPNDA